MLRLSHSLLALGVILRGCQYGCSGFVSSRSAYHPKSNYKARLTVLTQWICTTSTYSIPQVPRFSH